MDNGACSYRRFLEGDESAFDDIMKELFDNLIFFVNRYVHDLHTAEDIAIDVFTDLIVHKKRYNFKVSLKTYLFMLGKSRALNHLRHNRVINFVEINEAYEKDDGRDVEDPFIQTETQRLVNQAIEQLEGEMRAAVHLVYFEEMSYEEAGFIMKKSRKQIDNLLYRAKLKLRVILGKEELYFEKL